MPSLRDIRRRINSVKSTRQITSAMKLVAGAKLRRATENAEAARPYQQTLSRVLQRVASAATDLDEPLFQPHESIRKVDLLVFASDRGLCGGFNNNLLRFCERTIQSHVEQGRVVRIFTFGKKAKDYLTKRGYPVVESKLGLRSDDFVEVTRERGARMRAEYVDGSVDEVWLLFNQFKSVMTQKPTAVRLLPVSVQEATRGAGGETDAAADFDYEPDAGRILASLVPLYVETVTLQAFLETEAGEHAARMTAMDSATRNASELIDSLTLQYNRARQAAITKELIEIVSGADAL